MFLTPSLRLTNQSAQARVSALEARAEALGIRERVTFMTNAPYAQLKDQLRMAHAGLHTMWNEHFGIGVVELMAAGVITIAHNSAGPKVRGMVQRAPHQHAMHATHTHNDTYMRRM